ncbi:hypothetical protein SY89_00161 [Halolamina pelagica]|uniref:DUF4330 domain-containing protein n=1 Tax=Halolamina pelagica TaxID=699431 RepID=A0A0P7HYQ1_9EURY|nr:DUF4330 domain-containing protein [Halolamina pelagica]KPN29448.1 hypothetical protein SY89_00161 [Halolamina pelagica]
MELLDDDGNLFGVVNVVDALVVLFVLAVVAAGAAFVLQPEPEPEQPDIGTKNVTLDLGTQPDYLVSAINEGDTYSAGEKSELTITDVHLTPQGDQARVIVRAELRGVVSGDSIEYANAPPRLGRALDIATSTYQVNGRIRAVGGDDTLTTEETNVVISDTMSAADAEEVTEGDEIRLGERTVATVENVAVYATNDPNQRRVVAGATLETYTQSGERRFGNTPVRPGQTVTLPADTYTFNGQIERVGTLEPRGSTTERTVTLQMYDVREDFADAIQPGMTERAGDTTTARITDVETEPSVIITTGDNGSVNVVDHPYNRKVTITADLTLRETTTGLTFKGEPIRQGSTVVIDLGTITVEATVVGVGG